jgi:hypothetical protein
MKENKLIDLLNKENRWFSIKKPSGLDDRVVNFVESKIYKDVVLWKMLTLVNALSLAIMACFIVLFFAFYDRTKIVFVYPHSGNEKMVYLTKGNEKVPMVLDEEKGVWTVVIHVPHRKIENYEFIVEELSEEDIDVAPDNMGIEEE